MPSSNKPSIELQEALDVLQDVLEQACGADSMALSAYARGLRLLSQYGLFTIEHEFHRRVTGKYTHS